MMRAKGLDDVVLALSRTQVEALSSLSELVELVYT